MEHSRIGNPSRVVSPLAKTARELYGRVIAGQKKARELYAGRHVWRFLAKNPAPAVPWGRNLGIGVILELSFPSSECRCKGVYEPGTADPEENPSKIAVRARFLANW